MSKLLGFVSGGVKECVKFINDSLTSTRTLTIFFGTATAIIFSIAGVILYANFQERR